MENEENGINGKLTASVIITCLVAASCGLIFGYDIGISGGVTTMEPFLRKFFRSVLRKKADATRNTYCLYDNEVLTLFTSSLYIAGLGSSLVASRVTRVMGRRFTMVLGGCTFLIGASINGAAVNIAMLILGRIMLGFGVDFTNQVALACLLGTELGFSGDQPLSKSSTIWVLILMCIYAAGFGWSWGPLSWLIPSEIFPMKIRPAGQSISIAVNFATTFVLAQTFLTTLCHFKFGIFLLYAGWITIMTCFIAYFLPETKGVPLESMHTIWEQHWYWSRFTQKTTVNGVET